ncbi:MAG: hypothetical protein QM712_14365 [Bradyrhizobium sp.]
MWQCQRDLHKSITIILRRSGRIVSQQTKARIVACSRIHLGLISMHAGGPRKNGGIGFSISEPAVNIDIEPNDRLIISDQRPAPLADFELAELIRDVDYTRHKHNLAAASITISGSIKTHVGMGSGTAIRLGVLEALFTSNGQSPNRDKLVEQSKRGGTSGVGITSYFAGGMVLDLGRVSDGALSLPSSQSDKRRAPAAALPSLAMPAWPLCVCIPNDVRAKTQQEEVEFFKRVLPLSIEDTHRACYEAVFGIYAAVQDRDYGAFCRAVSSIQTTTWKALEWNEYGSPLQRLKHDLEQFGADCVGMSSLGPSLFCFAAPEVLARLSVAQTFLNCEIIQTHPNNTGRILLRSPP